MQHSFDTLVWVDCEMTGLNSQVDSILEIAMIITDYQLQEKAVVGPIIIGHTREQLACMDAVVQKMHTDNGLLDVVLHSSATIGEAQEKLIIAVREHCMPGIAFLAGNSVWQDAQFLRRFMPQLIQLLHYRIIDVTSLKELIAHWYPSELQPVFSKAETHRALDDIRESIAELAYYRGIFFK